MEGEPSPLSNLGRIEEPTPMVLPATTALVVIAKVDKIQYQGFETLSIPLKHMDDKTLVAMFVNRLDEKVTGRLLKMNYNGFLDVMEPAERIKGKYIRPTQELDNKTTKTTHIT